MKSDHTKLLEEAQHGQRLIVSSMMQEAGLPHFLTLDISMAQLKGLISLARQPGGTVRHFAEALHIGHSAASLLVDRLVQDGLVTRSEDAVDRRKMVLNLSSRGEELIARLRQERIEHDPLLPWLEQMSKQDLQALVQGVRALAQIAQAATGIIDPWQTEATNEGSSGRTKVNQGGSLT